MHYAQLIAVYSDASSASQAYETIRNKVNSCPKKEHVASRKLSNNKVTIEHDNTWTVTEENLVGWTHTRGFQKHVTLSGDSVEKKATDVLTKQLQKIG
jgi:hypothetical protein